MAEIFIRHSLNSRKTIKVNLALREFILVGEAGDSKWVLEVGTAQLDSDGNYISPEIIHNISEANLEDEVDKALASICSKVDWSDFEIDREAPRISNYYPSGENASIKSIVSITLVEDLPSSGIDLSEAKITFNNGEVDFDITNELKIEGDPYEYTLLWKAPKLEG